MCAKWQHNTQVPFDPDFRWRYRICSAHFEPICLMNMRLMHGSVPTLHLGPRAPRQLFDSDFEAISMRLDKQKSSSEYHLDQREQLLLPEEEDDEDENALSFLVPEMQLHEDAGAHADADADEERCRATGQFYDLQEQLERSAFAQH